MSPTEPKTTLLKRARLHQWHIGLRRRGIPLPYHCPWHSVSAVRLHAKGGLLRSQATTRRSAVSFLFASWPGLPILWVVSACRFLLIVVLRDCNGFVIPVVQVDEGRASYCIFIAC